MFNYFELYKRFDFNSESLREVKVWDVKFDEWDQNIHYSIEFGLIEMFWMIDGVIEKWILKMLTIQ